MEDLKRVFFHELGHFIANEINQRFYSGTGTKSITIDLAFPIDHLYVGDTRINLSPDEKEKKPPTRELLPETLAGLIYGCIVQAHYKNENLTPCANLNGIDDMNLRHGAMWANKIGDFL